MSRIHFWAFLRDDEGNVIENAKLNLYLTGTTNEAIIYSSRTASGGSSLDQSTWYTGTSGFFDFYIGDQYELSPSIGYSPTQKFDLKWLKSDYDGEGNNAEGLIDGIQPYWQFFRVDETDNTSDDKDEANRLISNQQAYDWQTHTDSTFDQHGMAKVNVYDPLDSSYNKLVSNKMFYDLFDGINAITSGGITHIPVLSSRSYGINLVKGGNMEGVFVSAGSNSYPEFWSPSGVGLSGTPLIVRNPFDFYEGSNSLLVSANQPNEGIQTNTVGSSAGFNYRFATQLKLPAIVAKPRGRQRIEAEDEYETVFGNDPVESDFSSYGWNIESPNKSIRAFGKRLKSIDTFDSENAYVTKIRRNKYYYDDFKFDFDFKVRSIAQNKNLWSSKSVPIVYNLGIFGLSNDLNSLNTLQTGSDDGLFVVWTSAGNIGIFEVYDGSTSETVSTNTFQYDITYYVTIRKDYRRNVLNNITLNIYSNSAKTTLVESIVHTLNKEHKFKYLYSFLNYGKEVTGDVPSGYGWNDLIENGDMESFTSPSGVPIGWIGENLELGDIEQDTSDYVSGGASLYFKPALSRSIFLTEDMTTLVHVPPSSAPFYQNFLGAFPEWSEWGDTTGKVTIGKHEIDVNNVTNQDIYVFSENDPIMDKNEEWIYEFDLTLSSTVTGNTGNCFSWGMSNIRATLWDHTVTGPYDHIFVEIAWAFSQTTKYQINLLTRNGANVGNDSTGGYILNFDDTYYYRVKHTPTGGLYGYGTVTLYIYSDSNRTVLIDTLIANLRGKNSWKYLYAFSANGLSSAPETLTVSNLRRVDTYLPVDWVLDSNLYGEDFAIETSGSNQYIIFKPEGANQSTELVSASFIDKFTPSGSGVGYFKHLPKGWTNIYDLEIGWSNAVSGTMNISSAKELVKDTDDITNDTSILFRPKTIQQYDYTESNIISAFGEWKNNGMDSFTPSGVGQFIFYNPSGIGGATVSGGFSSVSRKDFYRVNTRLTGFPSLSASLEDSIGRFTDKHILPSGSYNALDFYPKRNATNAWLKIQTDSGIWDVPSANRIGFNVSASEALTNFPLTVFLNSSSGRNSIDTTKIFTDLGENKKKIAVYSNGKQCPVEIEHWATSASQAVLHTKIPTVNVGGTKVYLYWDSTASDNPSVGEKRDAVCQSVWSEGYYEVWHFNDIFSGNTSWIHDSKNDFQGQIFNTDAGDHRLVPASAGFAGKHFWSIDHPTVGNEYANYDYSSPYRTFLTTTQPLTFEVMFRTSITGQTNMLLGKYEGLKGITLETRPDGGGVWQIKSFKTGESASDSATISGNTSNYNDGNWHVMTGTYSAITSTASDMDLYLDGRNDGFIERDNTPLKGEPEATSAPRYTSLTRSGSNSNVGGAEMAEVRISTVARSAGWSKLTSQGLFDDSNTFDSVESYGLSGTVDIASIKKFDAFGLSGTGITTNMFPVSAGKDYQASFYVKFIPSAAKTGAGNNLKFKVKNYDSEEGIVYKGWTISSGFSPYQWKQWSGVAENMAAINSPSAFLDFHVDDYSAFKIDKVTFREWLEKKDSGFRTKYFNPENDSDLVISYDYKYGKKDGYPSSGASPHYFQNNSTVTFSIIGSGGSVVYSEVLPSATEWKTYQKTVDVGSYGSNRFHLRWDANNTPVAFYLDNVYANSDLFYKSIRTNYFSLDEDKKYRLIFDMKDVSKVDGKLGSMELNVYNNEASRTLFNRIFPSANFINWKRYIAEVNPIEFADKVADFDDGSWVEEDSANIVTIVDDGNGWIIDGNPAISPNRHIISYDYGVAGITGENDYKVDVTVGNGNSPFIEICVWGITNTIVNPFGSQKGLYGAYVYYQEQFDRFAIRTYEDSGDNSFGFGTASSISKNVTYYLTIENISTGGGFGNGEIICKVYSDSNRTSLVDTIACDWEGTKYWNEGMRYLMALSSNHGGGYYSQASGSNFTETNIELFAAGTSAYAEFRGASGSLPEAVSFKLDNVKLLPVEDVDRATFEISGDSFSEYSYVTLPSGWSIVSGSNGLFGTDTQAITAEGVPSAVGFAGNTMFVFHPEGRSGFDEKIYDGNLDSIETGTLPSGWTSAGNGSIDFVDFISPTKALRFTANNTSEYLKTNTYWAESGKTYKVSFWIKNIPSAGYTDNIKIDRFNPSTGIVSQSYYIPSSYSPYGWKWWETSWVESAAGSAGAIRFSPSASKISFSIDNINLREWKEKKDTGFISHPVRVYSGYDYDITFRYKYGSSGVAVPSATDPYYLMNRANVTFRIYQDGNVVYSDILPSGNTNWTVYGARIEPSATGFAQLEWIVDNEPATFYIDNPRFTRAPYGPNQPGELVIRGIDGDGSILFTRYVTSASGYDNWAEWELEDIYSQVTCAASASNMKLQFFSRFKAPVTWNLDDVAIKRIFDPCAITSISYATSAWNLSGNGTYYVDHNHGLKRSRKFPVVQIYERDTDQLIQPVNFKDLSNKTIRVWLSYPQDVEITTSGEVSGY